MNGASPIILTKSGDDARMTVARHHIDRVVGDLVTTMRKATHDKPCANQLCAADASVSSWFKKPAPAAIAKQNQDKKVITPCEKGIPVAYTLLHRLP